MLCSFMLIAMVHGAFCLCMQNNAWKVQYFRICPIDFSVEGGELTATLKLKRSFVDEKYKALIDDMYEGASD